MEIKLEYQNIKIFLKKAMFLIGLKKVLRLKNLKTLCRGDMLLVILTEKELLERLWKIFVKNKLKEFRVENVIKRKGDLITG